MVGGEQLAKILLIEDNDALAGFLKVALEGARYEVDWVSTGTEGLYWLQHEQYSVAIVDWELPGMSGIDVCKTFRGSGGETPILMLTGKDKTEDLVEGFDAGADDYISKPFEMPELQARLKNLLRRKPTEHSDIIVVAGIELRSGSGEVLIGNQPVKLTRKEFNILELLMRNPGHPFTVDAIMQRVWPSDSEASPEGVRSHITRLRQRIAAVSEECANTIEAVYGMGYRIKVR